MCAPRSLSSLRSLWPLSRRVRRCPSPCPLACLARSLRLPPGGSSWGGAGAVGHVPVPMDAHSIFPDRRGCHPRLSSPISRLGYTLPNGPDTVSILIWHQFGVFPRNWPGLPIFFYYFEKAGKVKPGKCTGFLGGNAPAPGLRFGPIIPVKSPDALLRVRGHCAPPGWWPLAFTLERGAYNDE